MTTGEQLFRINGVQLCAQAFGDPADAAILLVHGMGASMLWWEDELCERLAAGGRYVVRYDHRDTGRSVSYPPGKPGYNGHDLVADAIGVLDAFGIEQAHFAGVSMGSGLSMTAAVDYPRRIASLTLMSTTSGDAGLPPPTEEFLNHYKELSPPDWSDREAVIGYLVEEYRVCAGGSPHFSEPDVRALVERDVERTTNIQSAATNHGVLPDDGEESPLHRLDELTMPTLVVQGECDPMFPPPNGQALADRIPGARLVTLENSGHVFFRPVWDVLVAEVLKQTAGPGRG
ncbi:alpha/beta fold hydrolase [Flindersiella endophytica]